MCCSAAASTPAASTLTNDSPKGDTAEVIRRLEVVARVSGGTISVTRAGSTRRFDPWIPAEPGELAVNEFSRHLDRSWRRHSFSAIAAPARSADHVAELLPADDELVIGARHGDEPAPAGARRRRHRPTGTAGRAGHRRHRFRHRVPLVARDRRLRRCRPDRRDRARPRRRLAVEGPPRAPGHVDRGRRQRADLAHRAAVRAHAAGPDPAGRPPRRAHLRTADGNVRSGPRRHATSAP